MSDEKIKIPPLVFEKDPTVKLDNKEMRLYDADTAINKENTEERFRFQGIDAQERPSFDLFEGLSYGAFADAERQEVKDYIDNRGFNKLKPIGEKDSYKRDLVRIENQAGEDLANTLIRDGILSPSQYNLHDTTAQEAYTASRFDALIGAQQDLPAWKQVENQILQGTTPRLGRLTWLEQQKMPSSFQPINKAIDNSFAGQADDAIELWWYQNVGAWHGLDALFVDEERGKEGMTDVQKEIFREISPGTIISLEQIEDVPDAFAWLQNNMIMHLPDFAIMAGGGKAGAVAGAAIAGPPGAAIGGVLGTIAGVGYNFFKTTGNIGQEQFETTGELDLAQALTLGTAVTAVDFIGAKGVIQPTDLLNKKGMARAVTNLKGLRASQGINITTIQARKEIEKGVKENLRKLATDININSTDFLIKRQIALNLGKKVLKQGGKEALTEAVQESIQALGIQGVPESAEEWHRFSMRLADAAAAGGLVGTTYNITDSLVERSRIENLRDSVSEYDSEKASLTEKLAVELNAENEYKTIEQTTENFKGAVDVGKSIFDRAKRGSRKGYARRAIDKISEGRYIPGLSSIKNILRPYLIKKNGRGNLAATLIANVESAYQTMPGNSLYNEEQSRVSDFSRKYAWLHAPESYFDVESDVTQERLSDILDKLRMYGINSSTLDYFDGDDKIIAETIGNELASLNYDLQEYHKKANGGTIDQFMADLLADATFLIQPTLPDTTKVFQNANKFKQALANHEVEVVYAGKNPGEKLGEDLAQEIIDNLFNGNPSAAVRSLATIGAHKSLKEFYPKSTFETVKSKVFSEVTSTVRAQYRGNNLEVYSNAINQMVEEDILTEEQADEMAADLIEQVNKHSGEFGKLKNKQLSDAQDIARMVTSFGIMDFVLFAQMGEATLTFMGTNKGVARSIGIFAKSFAESFMNTLPSINSKRKKKESKSIIAYEQGGYTADELLQQQGANMQNQFAKDIQKTFYKVNLLSQTTDAIRISRLVLAADTINQLIEELIGADFNNLTKAQAKIVERLSFYGGNPKKLVEIFTVLKARKAELSDFPEYQKEMELAWEIMTPKFVDEFSVRIKPGSRPTIFEDQRYGLPFLTQYLSFTAHFHANILPRLYTAYMKDATAPVALSTFRVMAATLVVAYISQYLKDLLVRGQLNPNLEETTGSIQRAIQYTGFLGWGQEAYDNMFGNAYGFESEGVLDFMSSYPTYSHLSRVAQSIGEGEFGEAAARGLPFGEFSKDTSAPMRLLDYFSGE